MPEATRLTKTMDDILTNYTSVEVADGVYVNNTLLKVFKNMGKDVTYLDIDKNSQIKSAVYECAISNSISVNIYTNSKHDYLEIVFFYKVPEIFDDNYMQIINMANIELRSSKACYFFDKSKTVEVSAVYHGDFSIKGFLRFMNAFQVDINSFNKMNDLYLFTIQKEMAKFEKEKELKVKIKKIVTSKTKTADKTRIKDRKIL